MMLMNYKISEFADTGWESLNTDGTIIGRIFNDIVTIRVWGYNLTINTAGNPYQILQLPNKYIPSRSIPFVLTRALANPETVSGVILNENPARIRVYSDKTGKFVLYGSVMYPL